MNNIGGMQECSDDYTHCIKFKTLQYLSDSGYVTGTWRGKLRVEKYMHYIYNTSCQITRFQLVKTRVIIYTIPCLKGRQLSECHHIVQTNFVLE